MKKLFVFLLFSSIVFAQTKEPALKLLLDNFASYIGGNSGKLLSLFGFMGTFIIYMMTHKGGVLFIGILLSLLFGAGLGMVDKNTLSIGYSLIVFGSILFYNFFLAIMLDDRFTLMIKKSKYI